MLFSRHPTLCTAGELHRELSCGVREQVKGCSYFLTVSLPSHQAGKWIMGPQIGEVVQSSSWLSGHGSYLRGQWYAANFGGLPTKAHEQGGQTSSSLLTALEARNPRLRAGRAGSFGCLRRHLPPVSLRLWWLLLFSEVVGLCVHSPTSMSWPHKEQKALPSIATVESGKSSLC